MSTKEDLESLRAFYRPRIDAVDMTFVRSQLTFFDRPTRMIGLKGARGVGKSTLLIQYAKQLRRPDTSWLYLSLDHFYFTTHGLVELVDEFLAQGGELLLLDEVHRYRDWSVALKTLYDAKPALRILFTGSSILELSRAKADLSRRAIIYELPGLSFREYLTWEGKGSFDPIPLADLLEYHGDLSHEFTAGGSISYLEDFRDYLSHGYYPYYKEGIEFYPLRLTATVDLLIEQDIPYFHSYTQLTLSKIKLLLRILAESPPFKPNITKLAERSGQTRQTILEQFQVLQSAGLLLLLGTERKGIVRLQKPDKVFLDNPNLAHHLADHPPSIGSIRDIFFYNQMRNGGHHLNSTDRTDFRAGDLYFEIGGKGKSGKQLQGLENGFIASDGIDVGRKNQVPLYLFGFLY